MAPPKKPKRLTGIVIKELSLVDTPANEAARVSIWKRADSAALAASLNKQGDEIMDLDAVSKSLEVAEAKLGELTKRADEADATIKRLSDENAVLKTDLEKAKAEAEAKDKCDKTPEELAKSDLPENVRKAVESLEKRAAEAEEKLAKAEAQAEQAEFIKKAGGYSNVPFKAEDIGGLLMRVAKGMTTAADAKTLEGILKSLDEASKQVMAERGISKSDPDSPIAKLDRMAKDVAEKEGITYAKAYAKVMEANTELYEASLKAS